VGDVELAAALGLFGDDVLGLALGADEQDAAAAGDGLAEEGASPLEELDGLAEVDDEDAVTGAVDVGLHLGVPALGLVAKVGAGFEHLTHANLGHEQFSLALKGFCCASALIISRPATRLTT
jgi:hypothetical protein